MVEFRGYWGGDREWGKMEGDKKKLKKGPSKYCICASVCLATTGPLMWCTGWIKEKKSIPIFL